MTDHEKWQTVGRAVFGFILIIGILSRFRYRR